MLPHSEACDRNKDPILAVLKVDFAHCTHVLEIGSGTGQHAVHFASALPASSGNRRRCRNRCLACASAFSRRPVEPARPGPIDVNATPWDVRRFDGVFSANTLHIMRWPEVEAFFAGLPAVAKPGTVLAIYGPFHYRGQYTTDGNEAFDAKLTRANPWASATSTTSMH